MTLRTPKMAVAAGSLLLLAILVIPMLDAGAQDPATAEFERTWERTDKPVADLVLNRTWIWGPDGLTAGIAEPYAEAPGGQRLVQYFDKARMEIPPNGVAEPGSPWYVTTGLLPIELMTGKLQLGDDLFEQYLPAEINIAGDPTDESAPSYAEVAALMNLPARPVGQTVIATVDENGQPGLEDRFATYGVTGSYFVPETSHTVASVFWDFMNSSGTISVDSQLSVGPLFQDPFFGFGFPVTEAYWSTIELDSVPTDILIQVFERRVATYTPDNPDGWKVETGNVGRHYHEWRYEIINADEREPAPTPPDTVTATPTATEPPSDDPAPTATATAPEEDCIACELEHSRGEIGAPGKEPLGEGEYSSLTLPYLEVPEAPNDTIDKVVVGTNGVATLNFPDTIALVSDWSPSDKVVFVVDYNDGSAYVSGAHDAHIGLNVTHTYYGRGEFHVKVWAYDPEADVRTPVVEFVTVVE